MEILLKNADLYSPNHMGKVDILIKDGVVKKIDKQIDVDCDIIDCRGKIVTPMFVDGHEHIAFQNYYTPQGIINSGVGTVLGVLAWENGEKYVINNIKIAKSLKEYGIQAYALAGSKTYRENITEDIINNDIVMGVKTALNSQTMIKDVNPTYEELKELAVSTYNAGKQSKKSVQVHIHLETEGGDFETCNLSWIDRVVEETGVPYSIFKLTHAQKYRAKILEYANKGCYIDYTAFHEGYDSRYDYLVEAIKSKKVDLSKISISSDLGILNLERNWNKEESPFTLLHTLRTLIDYKGLKLEEVLPFITTNAGAQIDRDLGCIMLDGEAKLLILNNDLMIETIIQDKIIDIN